MNEYLLNEVRMFAMKKGVKVQRATDWWVCLSHAMVDNKLSLYNSWTGVVRGAVLAGMGIGCAIPTKVQTFAKHYGIATRRNGPVTWIFRKGAILEHNPAVIPIRSHVEFPETDFRATKSANIWFVTSSQQKPPHGLSGSERGKYIV
jgi:hypothetical protein